jgi:dolichol kinase
MHSIGRFFYWLNTPFRVLSRGIWFLLNLTTQQMRALFSLSMIGGIVILSFQNVWYTYRAEKTVKLGHEYHSFFELLLEQLRFNSGLIAWFAVIMGLIVFGADYIKAKWGDNELNMGKVEKNPDA